MQNQGRGDREGSGPLDKKRRIDLHVHSTASDGTMEPLEIIEASAAAGLAAVSITDHDCVEGCIRVIESGIPLPVKFLTGVEI
ncbi:MAG: hypothetical protein DRH32_06015, partial [Deltaproteobacteria bacterium]